MTMRKLDRYNEYCLLTHNLNEKNEELAEAANQKAKLEYQVNTIKRKITDYTDISSLPSNSLQAIRRSQIAECLNQATIYKEGGSVSESPVKSFKKSNEYNEYTSYQKKLYGVIEPSLIYNQYSIETALSVLDDAESDIDIYGNTTLEDFIDDMMINMEGYEALPTKDLKQIKKIIYNFVEHTSKFN